MCILTTPGLCDALKAIGYVALKVRLIIDLEKYDARRAMTTVSRGSVA